MKKKLLERIQASGKTCSALALVMVAACLFSSLTCGTFTDAALITNGAVTASIPTIGLSLPVLFFLRVSPWLLLAVHLYFLVILQQFKQLIANLSDMHKTGPLCDLIDPSLFNSLVPGVSANRTSTLTGKLTWLETVLAVVLAYLLVPASIWFLWIRGLPLHGPLSYFTIAAMALSVFASVWLRTMDLGSHDPAGGWLKFRWWFFFSLFVVGAGFGVRFSCQASSGELDTGSSNWWTRRVVYCQTARVQLADVSKRPANWTGTKSKSEEEIGSVIGASLQYQNLRFMRGFHTFLVNSNLKSANLHGADLAWSDLRGALLEQADLSNANLGHANLAGADLNSADLRGADLSNANLSDTNFSNANLSDTNFSNANL